MRDRIVLRLTIAGVGPREHHFAGPRRAAAGSTPALPAALRRLRRVRHTRLPLACCRGRRSLLGANEQSAEENRE